MRRVLLFFQSPFRQPCPAGDAALWPDALRRLPADGRSSALLGTLLLALILVLVLPAPRALPDWSGGGDARTASLVSPQLDNAPTYPAPPHGCLLPERTAFLLKQGPNPCRTAILFSSCLFWIWLLYAREGQHKILLI